MVAKRILEQSGDSAAEVGVDAAVGGVAADEVIDVAEEATFTSEELREFLEADLAGELADPEFKERLREKLWNLVKRRQDGGSPEEG